jgi:hypothetical protein
MKIFLVIYLGVSIFFAGVNIVQCEQDNANWDIGHGGISPYLKRSENDHNDEANRALTPSELMKAENIVTSKYPWYKSSKLAIENCKKNPKCHDKHCRTIRKIGNLIKCNNLRGGALASTMYCSKSYSLPYSYQCVDESPLFNGDRGWAARK